MLNKLYDRISDIVIRLFRKKEPYSSLSKILGFYPGNKKLYKVALLHKSSSEATHEGKWINNERLEFLGDAILDAVIAAFVYRRYPNRREGFLTNIRSKIVQREALNRMCLELGLDRLIVCSAHVTSHTNHIYGNALEALIGAVYLDKGFDACYKFICEKIVSEHFDLNAAVHHGKNDKSYLIEWCQKNKIEIEFNLLDTHLDLDRNMIFQSEVRLEDKQIGMGTGYSKKESQIEAARVALKKLHTDKSLQQYVKECKENSADTLSPEEPENDKPLEQQPTDIPLT